MFLCHHSNCKKFLHTVLFSIFLLNSPLSHLKEEKKMLRANQTYISLEKNDKKPPGSGVKKTVGGMSTQALAKAAFLRRFSRFLASVSESILAFLRHFSGLFLVISWSTLFFTPKESASQVQLQISYIKWPIYAINSVDNTKLLHIFEGQLVSHHTLTVGLQKQLFLWGYMPMPKKPSWGIFLDSLHLLFLDPCYFP